MINEFALVRMYKDKNMKIHDICSSLGISPVTLYDRLHKMGVSTRQPHRPKGKRLTSSVIRKIYTMHVAGNTRRQIASQLGIAQATVTHHLNKGIPAELYTPPVQPPAQPPMIQAAIVVQYPSIWARIKALFN